MQLTVLSADRAQILLLFYKPSATDPLFNRAVALFCPPFCHVEMAFPERYGAEPCECDIFGSSIYQGETVFYKKKSYARDGYVCLTIEVSLAQQWRVKNYCKNQSNACVPFNRWAMYGSYIPLFRTDEGTFCSKHITNALKYGGVLHQECVDACRMTPSGLHAMLCDKQIAAPIVQVVPARMNNTSDTQRDARNTIMAMQPSQPHETRGPNMVLAMLQAPRAPNKEKELTACLTLAMKRQLFS